MATIFKILRSAVGYIRVSLQGDDAQKSVDEQKRSINRYADERGIEIVNWYVDGSGVERSSLQDLLTVARSPDHSFDEVLVWRMSYLVGSIPEFHAIRSELEESGVKVVSVTESDTNSPVSRSVDDIAQAVNAYVQALDAYDRERHREATRRGIYLARRRRQGF